MVVGYLESILNKCIIGIMCENFGVVFVFIYEKNYYKICLCVYICGLFFCLREKIRIIVVDVVCEWLVYVFIGFF